MPGVGSGNVDERIVEMRIDHDKFEAGAKKTIDILEKLDAGLKSLGKENADGFDSVGRSLDKVTDRFSAMGIVGDQVIRNLTNKAMELIGHMGRLATSLSLDQISVGWGKYGEKTQGVQTIMAATAKDWEDQGAQIEWVNSQLEKLNLFTDETSYNFLDMVNNIGKFTSNGVKLETAVTAMEGISNWAAISGGTINEAGRAMYNMSQALAVGSVKLMDWKSIENANMATREFKETALETAVALGTLTKRGDAFVTKAGHSFTVEQFNTQLSDGWFSSDVLLEVLNTYGKFTDVLLATSEETGETVTELLRMVDVYKETGKASDDLLPYIKELSKEEYDLGRRAFKAAQEAKTFQEAIDATKDAVSTGWMNLFETMFGNYLTAKGFWTGVANSLYDIFAEPINKLNDIMDLAFNGENPLKDSLTEAGYSMHELETAAINLGDEGINRILENFESLEDAIKAGAIGAEDFQKILDQMNVDRLNDIVNGKNDDFNKKIDDIKQNAEWFLDGAVSKETLEARGYDVSMIEWWADVIKRQTTEAKAAAESIQSSKDATVVDLKKAQALLEKGGYTLEDFDTAASNLGDSGLNKLITKYGSLQAAMDQGVVSVDQFMEAYLSMTEESGDPYLVQFMDQYSDQLLKLAGYTDEEIEKLHELGLASEEVLSLMTDEKVTRESGFKLFTESLQNLLNVFSAVSDAARKAFNIIFGGTDEETNEDIANENVAERIYQLIKRFHDFTQSLQITEDGAKALRDKFINLFDAFSSIGSIVDLIKGILGGIFNLAVRLFNTLRESGIFRDIVSSILTLLQALLIPVQLIISGIVALIDKGKELGKQSWAQSLAEWVGKVGNKIKEAATQFKDFMSSAEVSNFITSGLSKIASILTAVWSALRRVFGAIDLSNIQKSLPTLETFRSFFEDIRNAGILGSLSGRFVGFFNAIKEAFSGFSINTDGLTNAIDRIKELLGLAFEGLFGDPDAFKERVKNSVLNILEGIKEALSQITLKDVLTTMRLGGLAALLAELAGIFKTFNDIKKQVVTIPESISKMFGKLGDAFGSLGTTFKTAALVNIMIGVGILAGSLYLLAKIPDDDLTHAAVVVGLLFLVISQIAKNLASTKLIGNNVDIKQIQVFSNFATTLFALALTIGAIGFSIAKITKAIQDAGITNVLYAAGILGGFLVAVALIVGTLFAMANRMSTYKRMDAIGNTMLKLAGSMYIIVAAIRSLVIPLIALAYAIKMIGNDNMGQAAIDIFAFAVILAGIMLGLTALLTLSKSATPSKIDKIGNALLKISGGMMLIAFAIGSLAMPMIAIAAAIRWINTEKNEVGIAGGQMAVLALVLGGITAGLIALLSMKSMTPAKVQAIGTAMLKIAGSMAIIAIAIGMLAAPMIAIGLAIKTIGSENMGQAFNTIMAFAVIMGVLAGIALLAGKFGSGTGMILAASAMAILALGINFLVPALIAFIAVGAGLAALVTSIENFEEAIGRLAKVAAVMAVFGLGVFMAGIGVAALGAGLTLTGVSVLIFAAAIWVLSKAFKEVSTAFPLFIEGIASAGQTIKDNWVQIVLGTVAFVALAFSISKLIGAIGKLVNGEKFGRGFSSFLSSIGIAIGNMASTLGDKLTDILPKILPILGTVLVMVALYLVDLIPELTEITVSAFTTLFNSIAASLEGHRGEIAESIRAILTEILHVIGDTVEETLFNAEFWSDLDLFEKILLGIGSVGMAAALVKNLLAPLKLGGDLLGGNGGLSGKAEDAKAAIELLIEQAGGLGAVLGPLLLIAAASAYAIDNINKQQQILSDNAFEGLAHDAEGYETAIANTKARIDELQEQEKSGWGTEMSSQELSAQQTLLAQLEKEYAAYKQQQEAAFDSSAVADQQAQIQELESEIARLTDELNSGNADARTEKILNAKRHQLEALMSTTTAADAPAFDLQDAYNNAEAEINSRLSEMGVDLSSAVPGIFGGEGGVGSVLMQTISGDVTANAGLMTTALTDGEMSAVNDADAVAVSAAQTNGYNVSAGVAQGIYNGSPLVTSAMSYMSSLLTTGFQTNMDINSPSRVMERLAAFIPSGVARGIENNIKEPVDSMTILGSAVLAAMQQAMMNVATIADDSFEYNPMITPVVDMSNVTAAAGSAGGMFGGVGMALRASSRVSMDTAQNTAAAVTYSGGAESIVSELQRMGSRLDNLGEAITNMKVVLDSGELVGATSRQMDDAFGVLQMRKGRGN